VAKSQRQIETEARIKKNREIQRGLERALRKGEQYPGARFFIWSDTLYYGMTQKRTRNELQGNYVSICDLDMDSSPAQKATMRRAAELLNRLNDKRPHE
jgi:hypothetical protein